jgi:cytoskeletal protein RodZ
MRKVMVLCFAFVLVLSMVAVAQDAAQPTSAKQDSAQSSAKADTVSGKVSDDGKSITDKDGKSWTVSNPDSLKGHEGHEVTLKGDVDSSKNEVKVDSVKMAGDTMTEAPKK